MKPQQDEQPYSISIIDSGTPETATLTAFASPVRAHLMRRDTSAPVSGASITFTVSPADGLDGPLIRPHGSDVAWDDFAPVDTDSTGNAAVDALAGRDAGTFQVKAQYFLAYNTPVYQSLRVTGSTAPPSPQVQRLEVTQGSRQTGFQGDAAFPAAIQARAVNWLGQGVGNAAVSLNIDGNTGTVFADSGSPQTSVRTASDGQTPALQLIPGNRPGRFTLRASCPDSPQCPPAQFDLALAPPVQRFHFRDETEPLALSRGSVLTSPFGLLDGDGHSWPYIPVDAVIETGYPGTFYFGAADDKRPSILALPDEQLAWQYAVPLWTVDSNVVDLPTGALRLEIHGRGEVWRRYRLQHIPARV